MKTIIRFIGVMAIGTLTACTEEQANTVAAGMGRFCTGYANTYSAYQPTYYVPSYYTPTRNATIWAPSGPVMVTY